MCLSHQVKWQKVWSFVILLLYEVGTGNILDSTISRLFDINPPRDCAIVSCIISIIRQATDYKDKDPCFGN